MKSIHNNPTQLQNSENIPLTPHPISPSEHKPEDIVAIKTSYTTVIDKNKPIILTASLLLAALIIMAIINKDQLTDLFSPEPEFQLKDVMGVTYFENGKKVNTVDNIDPKTKKWLEEYYQREK